MTGRLDVKIPEDMLNKIREITQTRPDLRGYKESKQVLIILQEAIRENLNKNISERYLNKQHGPLGNGPVV